MLLASGLKGAAPINIPQDEPKMATGVAGAGQAALFWCFAPACTTRIACRIGATLITVRARFEAVSVRVLPTDQVRPEVTPADPDQRLTRPYADANSAKADAHAVDDLTLCKGRCVHRVQVMQRGKAYRHTWLAVLLAQGSVSALVVGRLANLCRLLQAPEPAVLFFLLIHLTEHCALLLTTLLLPTY